MKKLFIITFLITAATISCKNTKNAQTDVITEQEQKDAMRREAFKANPVQKVDVDEIKIEESQEQAGQTEKTEATYPDSLVARIQRTPCYGSCPIYTISVYNTGFATYEGERFVEHEGYYGAFISRNVLNTLQNMAREIGFLELQDRYDDPGITDIPSTITTIRLDGQLKTVVNRDGGPEKLREFEKFFDSLFKEVEWDDDYQDPNAE